MRAMGLADLWIMEIKQIALGSQGLVVPMIGLGCMGMTGFEEGICMALPMSRKPSRRSIVRSS